MRTKPLLIVSFALALVAGACANGPTETSGPSTASRSPSAPGSASTSTGPSASDSSGGVSTSANTSSSAPTASTPTCTPENPTALSANWAPLQAHDGDFSFKFPANWDKLYGAFVFKTNSLLDAQTFAETGLPSTSTTRADLVRTPGSGLPNASVLIVPGVLSNTATVFARQVERFKAIADIEVIASNLIGCVGGEQALGISFTFGHNRPSPSAGGSPPPPTYQESWYMVRSGRVYDFQWLAQSGQEQTETFKEIARTWAWTGNVPVATPLPPSSSPPSAAPSVSAGASSFVLAGMATKVDPAATAANPRDFVTTIPKESTSIYAVFSLKTGLTGQVNGALKQGDRVLVTLSLQYGPKHTWGNFRINSANGFAPGDYTMVITYAPSGETINLPFVVK